MKPASIKIQGLEVVLKDFHLDNIHLDIQSGEYFVILGPTGAGKTVLLEAIAGLVTPKKGQILIDQIDMTQAAPEDRKIGFVYQDYLLFPHLSVRENISYGLKVKHGIPEEINREVVKISKLLNIEHLLDRNPKTLSGGEQQRTALARAFLIEPRVLLMDEPLSALDPETRETLQRDLTRLHKEIGATTIHITHNFEEAVALGDRIAVMQEGRIIQVGTPDEIFRKPNSKFTAQFVGTRNVFEGEVRDSNEGGSTFKGEGIEIAVVSAFAGRAHASIRPEDIILSRTPIATSARNQTSGEIVEIQDRGATIFVNILVPPLFSCMITHRSLEELNLHIGDTVYLAFKATAVHVF